MATDTEIQRLMQHHHGFIPKTGWITVIRRVGHPCPRVARLPHSKKPTWSPKIQSL
jgi:hypothetical protein